MTEPLMTAIQVAELLAVPKTRVWSMSRLGEIPTVRIGPREVRYRREDIERMDRSADDVSAAGHPFVTGLLARIPACRG